ncbi:hypothetical protein BABINDRAFT_161717 [Babjeviella inositovora NRRL Y-12698]|uniref:Major facilitator superfamily (MFS) profile domain-containing protein n=1 Tax=Babjeviella inositovora NRRL Y-12698 TaxID=984486 RepID=A0A1E3QQW1_9ASCO|nr:uncharacterized protein BABINDRAFT_161717 [Babjeviella inositovora NRRL Y-12698]ODQ80083.1 hypothetical protein BABINDRAFT_161717 [Babjeviella inositovora NRRL Y-12698]
MSDLHQKVSEEHSSYAGEKEDSAEVPVYGFESDDEKNAKLDALITAHGINHTKLMWKIDICVVPPFCLLYFLAFLDRVNISNAKVYGMADDLKLTGNQFNTALTIFFVPYVFFEVLSNFAIKRIAPHIWLSGCILCFGAVSIGMGFVKNFGGLVACRFLLGIFESGAFPAVFYILSNYYQKQEAQRRFSVFFSVTCLAGAAGGALAAKIIELDGRYGIESWQWIFIIEGAFTAGLAFVLFFTISDFPETARFLNENERAFLKAKLEIFNGASGFEEKTTLKDTGGVFKDYLIWLPAIAYFGLIVPAYGYAYFSPTIIKQMGYTAVAAQNHSVYPWLLAFGLSISVSFASDRLQMRFPFAVGAILWALMGLAFILGGTHNPRLRYAGCFLTASGIYTAMPIIVCWASLNFSGHLRKSVGTAWQIGFGNIGGIIATFIFLAKDSPRYVPGLSVSIAFSCLALLFVCIYFFAVRRLNRLKLTEAYRSKFSVKSLRDQVLCGDRNPNFKYLL